MHILYNMDSFSFFYSYNHVQSSDCMSRASYSSGDGPASMFAFSTGECDVYPCNLVSYNFGTNAFRITCDLGEQPFLFFLLIVFFFSLTSIILSKTNINILQKYQLPFDWYILEFNKSCNAIGAIYLFGRFWIAYPMICKNISSFYTSKEDKGNEMLVFNVRGNIWLLKTPILDM